MKNLKKNMKKFKKQYFACQPGPECGYFSKTSIFVFSGAFLGFFGLSMVIIGLEKVSKAFKHWYGPLE
jgi:hypothetical protein